MNSPTATRPQAARRSAARFALVLTAVLTLHAPALAQWSSARQIGSVEFFADRGLQYVIHSNCSITSFGYPVAQVRLSYDTSFAWYYYIPRTGQAFGVDYQGGVWANGFGGWQVVGRAVWHATC